MNNWLSLVMRALIAVPSIVLGIEHMHAELPGATKKQLAMDALSIASGTASMITPENQGIIDAATQLTANTIDSTVSFFNQTGIFQKKSAPIAAVPIPPSATASSASQISTVVSTAAAPISGTKVAPTDLQESPAGSGTQKPGD